jgi:Acyclic terpene utilisation family protein AtuA
MTASGEIRLLANCVVGLGFSRRGFEAGLARGPHLIGCDAGSADYGPAYLGSGNDPKSSLAIERDLRIMVAGAKRVGAPLVIGSCGGAGGDVHLDRYVSLLGQIAQSEGLSVRVALIRAELSPEYVLSAVARDAIRPLGEMPSLDAATVNGSTRIVAMMGAGPFERALDAGVDVILAGRCADPAIFVGAPLRAGRPAGPSWHAAKSIDKGYLATTEPHLGSPVLATVSDDGFVIEPMLDAAACTPDSVARITLHENPNPFQITQPSGALQTARFIERWPSDRC